MACARETSLLNTAREIDTGDGVIYLLHFADKLAHAGHYMGWSGDLGARLINHRSGRGSAILRACSSKEIAFTLVRIWAGDRNLERRLKNRKEASRLCPLCRQKKLATDRHNAKTRRMRQKNEKRGITV